MEIGEKFHSKFPLEEACMVACDCASLISLRCRNEPIYRFQKPNEAVRNRYYPLKDANKSASFSFPLSVSFRFILLLIALRCSHTKLSLRVESCSQSRCLC
jgi:hypothetical protein